GVAGILRFFQDEGDTPSNQLAFEFGPDAAPRPVPRPGVQDHMNRRGHTRLSRMNTGKRVGGILVHAGRVRQLLLARLSLSVRSTSSITTRITSPANPRRARYP